MTIFSQAIQVTLVGLALTGFFVLFGFLAIPEATIEAWTTLDSIEVFADVTVGDRILVLSEPLVRVAAFLGAFTAMYFTVLLSTDATYRDEFAEDVAPELRQALAVRCVYHRAEGARRERRRDPRARRRRRPAPLGRGVRRDLGHERARSSSVELLRAAHHAGGYLRLAEHGGQVVGGSFGFLARHHGEPALHSHVTGLLPGVRHTGIGRAIKLHQRAWAAANGLAWIVWTFDPLVRRNAWFNLGVLGARVEEYLVDFYGPIDDTVNAGDETDRLLVAWAVHDAAADGARAGPARRFTVPTPEDIVALRRTDPDGGGQVAAAAADRARGRLGRRRRRSSRSPATASTWSRSHERGDRARAARDHAAARHAVPDQLRHPDDTPGPAPAGRGRAGRDASSTDGASASPPTSPPTRPSTSTAPR